MDQFERHIPIDRRLISAIHFGHAALTNELDELITSDRFAGQAHGRPLRRRRLYDDR